MHLSEGVLSAPLLVSGAVLAAGGCAMGLRRLEPGRIMPTAMLAAAFFVASLIHVPIGPGKVHLVLNGLMAAVLGWSAFPAILVALTLQALFFQYGGFTVLGVNTVIMAGPALALALPLRPWLSGPRRNLAACIIGAGSVALSAIAMALVLLGSDERFFATAAVVLAAHLPLMLVEGLITMFVVGFLARVQPEILYARL